jgi:hypothetical protein
VKINEILSNLLEVPQMTQKAPSRVHILNGWRNSEKRECACGGRGDIRQDFQLKCRISAALIYATLPAHLTFLDLIIAGMHGQRATS